VSLLSRLLAVMIAERDERRLRELSIPTAKGQLTMRHFLTVPDTPQEPEPLGSGQRKDRTRRVTRVSDQHR